MTPSLIAAFRRIRIFLLFVVVLACDTFNGDEVGPEKQIIFSKTEYYTLPGSSIVIDLKTSIKQAFTSVSLTVSENPEKGVLTQIDTLLFKYTPGVDFIEGQDQFALSGTLDDGSIVTSGPLLIYVKESVEEFPCGVYAIEDYAQANKSKSTAIHILENDRVCPVTDMNVFIRVKPKFGDAEVVGDSIVYRPGPEFTGTDEMVYRLASDSDEHVTNGIISLTAQRIEILKIDNYSPFYPTRIFFVNDTVGFISGGYSIYKTNDGGRNWNLSMTLYGSGSFGELYFLDKDHGFVAFTEGSNGGWMMTTDGGTSWKRTYLGHSVRSIFFTSQLTGFTVTHDYISQSVVNTIYKTTDGGETWNEVFAGTFKEELNARFVNDQIGYAYDRYSIFATTDGGESWRELTKNNYVTFFARASGNIVWAGLLSVELPEFGGWSSTTPSHIVRSDDGVTWTRVRDFPYPIYTLGFSPQGDNGVVVGHTWDHDPSVKSIYHISRSTDKGETWVDYSEEFPGYSLDISVPSNDVVFILGIEFGDEPHEWKSFIIKYTP